MPTLQVDSVTFTFQQNMAAQKYDEWLHYRTVWNALGGRKAVDLVAMRMTTFPPDRWLIEVKGFRVVRGEPDNSNIAGLAQTVADKMRDSLDGLSDAAAHATEAEEKKHAVLALRADKTRVVLHLEPHEGRHSALFPRRLDAGVFQKLKQLVGNIDPNPLVLNIANTAKFAVPWTAA